MRKTIIVTIEIEDNSEEKYNWLADTIALENAICDSLSDGATVHCISATPEDEFHWYDCWDDRNGNYAYVRTSVKPDDQYKLEKEFREANRRKKDEEASDYNTRFISWLRERNHSVYIVQRPDESFGVQ